MGRRPAGDDAGLFGAEQRRRVDPAFDPGEIALAVRGVGDVAIFDQQGLQHDARLFERRLELVDIVGVAAGQVERAQLDAEDIERGHGGRQVEQVELAGAEGRLGRQRHVMIGTVRVGEAERPVQAPARYGQRR